MNENAPLFIEEITDSKEVMQATAPPVARWFIAIIFMVVFSIVIFLFFFQRDIAIRAQGIVAPSELTESVISVAGGKVVLNKVENGTLVNIGDVLIELDVRYAEQQLSLFKSQLQDIESNIVSLQTLKTSYEQDTNLLAPEDSYYYKYQEFFAEKSIIVENSNISDVESQQMQQSTNALSVFYKGRVDGISYRLGELERLQNAILNSQQFSSNDTYIQSIYNVFLDGYNSIKRVLDNEVANYSKAKTDFSNGKITQEELDDARASVDALQLQLTTLTTSNIEKIQIEVTTAQTQKTSYEDQIAQLNSQGGNVDHSALLPLSVDQLKAQKLSEVETLLESTNKELESYRLQIIDLEEQIRDGALIANTTGIVMFENEIIEGEIIQPGTTVLHIVPDNKEYKVTLYVSDRDIAKVKVGESALLSINAFPYQEYGRLSCKIIYMSATSIPAENIGQVYIVEAILSKNALVKNDGTQHEISAGMTVEADIVYGTESWMSWLLREIHLK
jgi:multidrug resistance efflux pump